MDMQGNSECWGDIVGRDFQAFLCHFQMSSRLYSLAKLSLSSNSIFPQKKVSDRSIFTWLQKAGILGKGGGHFFKRVLGMCHYIGLHFHN